MNQKILSGVALSMLLVILGIGVSDAKSTSANTGVDKVDPVQSKNTRHKTPHADRKSAARHLKTEYQQERQAELQKKIREHQGFSGRGRAGTDFTSQPKPSKKGGVK
jgi:hypothetical protein